MELFKDIISIFHLSEAAIAILVLSLTIILGLAFGKINFRGVRFGVAGVTDFFQDIVPEPLKAPVRNF